MVLCNSLRHPIGFSTDLAIKIYLINSAFLNKYGFPIITFPKKLFSDKNVMKAPDFYCK